MAGAMVPRNIGDQRLARQRREQELDRHTLGITQHIGHYRQHRDAIRDHLWAVYSERLYLATHTRFEDWFMAQSFTEGLSYRTGKRLISEKRDKGSPKTRHVGPFSNQKGSKSVLDFFKNPLPENCRPVYLNKALQNLIDQIGEAMAKWEAPEFQFALEREQNLLPWHDAAKFQEDIQRVTYNLRLMLNDLKENRPMGVCPKCKGKRCPECRQSGMVPRAVYERLKQENADG